MHTKDFNPPFFNIHVDLQIALESFFLIKRELKSSDVCEKIKHWYIWAHTYIYR